MFINYLIEVDQVFLLTIMVSQVALRRPWEVELSGMDLNFGDGKLCNYVLFIIDVLKIK